MPDAGGETGIMLAPTKTPPGVFTWPCMRDSQERVQHTLGALNLAPDLRRIPPDRRFVEEYAKSTPLRF